MEATIYNMRAHYRDGVFAYSPGTGERYSANPHDYWMGLSGPLTDANGDAMILAMQAVVALEP